MILKKLVKSRKAISPVIATLLLILIAVASGLVLYSYVMGYLGSMTKGGSSMQGILSLDSATATAPSSITAYVRNVGSVAITINQAYIDGTNATSVTKPSIDPGAVKPVSIVPSSSLVAGTSYSVKLVASDGTSLVFNVKP